MRTLRSALPLAAFLVACGAAAQAVTPESYFNQASKEFVKQDKMTALRTLDRGLQTYPDDPKLRKLAEELLKDEEKKQQQQQKEQQQEQQQQQEKQKDKEEQGQDGKDQDQNADEQQAKPEQPERNEPMEQRKPEQANNIAPQDAMRMLDALERSEKDIQEKVRVRRRPVARHNIEKDW